MATVRSTPNERASWQATMLRSSSEVVAMNTFASPMRSSIKRSRSVESPTRTMTELENSEAISRARAADFSISRTETPGTESNRRAIIRPTPPPPMMMTARRPSFGAPARSSN